MPHSSAAAVSGQESFRPNNIAVAGISKGMPLKINMKYYKYLNLKKMFHIFKKIFSANLFSNILLSMVANSSLVKGRKVGKSSSASIFQVFFPSTILYLSAIYYRLVYKKLADVYMSSVYESY